MTTPEALKIWSDGQPSPATRGETTRLRLVSAEGPVQPTDSAGQPTATRDAVLVARARLGEAKAFEALVRRHLRAGFLVARQLVVSDADAEDVCQDAFVKALERLDECREPDRFRSWFLAIVRNRAHNLRKYEKRRQAESLDLRVASPAAGPARDLDQVELRRRLAGALDQLTEKQRQVVLLHDYEGWQHAEIGERLGISAGASRFNLHAARKKLRKLLESDRPEERP